MDIEEIKRESLREINKLVSENEFSVKLANNIIESLDLCISQQKRISELEKNNFNTIDLLKDSYKKRKNKLQKRIEELERENKKFTDKFENKGTLHFIVKLDEVEEEKTELKEKVKELEHFKDNIELFFEAMKI